MIGGSIRTPDQRLRVFVSSTLAELAAERAAAREAIERLQLTPVLFELGARPHPPRDLYRAYFRWHAPKGGDSVWLRLPEGAQRWGDQLVAVRG